MKLFGYNITRELTDAEIAAQKAKAKAAKAAARAAKVAKAKANIAAAAHATVDAVEVTTLTPFYLAGMATRRISQAFKAGKE